MSLTNLTLLSTTIYGIASGNYDGSSLDFTSDPVQAVNYYRGQGSIQTVTIQTTELVSVIKLEATLNDTQAVNTDQAAWFEVYSYGDGSTVYTETHPVTITGNFTYLRARVLDFEAGTINSITVTY
jgi:hypothetical protein